MESADHHACFMLCCAGIQGFEHARQALYTPAISLLLSQLSGLLSKLSFGKQAFTKANRGKLKIGPKTENDTPITHYLTSTVTYTFQVCSFLSSSLNVCYHT